MVEQGERRLDRRRARVLVLRPRCFFVWLGGRMVLGQGELETRKRIHMTVRHVMNDLTYGPPVGAIWSVELLIVQSCHGGAKALGGFGDGIDRRATLRIRERGRTLEAADGIGQSGHAKARNE